MSVRSLRIVKTLTVLNLLTGLSLIMYACYNASQMQPCKEKKSREIAGLSRHNPRTGNVAPQGSQDSSKTNLRVAKKRAFKTSRWPFYKRKPLRWVSDKLRTARKPRSSRIARETGSWTECVAPIVIKPNPLTLSVHQPLADITITCPVQPFNFTPSVGQRTFFTFHLQFKVPGNDSDFELGLINGDWNARDSINYNFTPDYPIMGDFVAGKYKEGGLYVTLNQNSCRYDKFSFKCTFSVKNQNNSYRCRSSTTLRVDSQLPHGEGELMWRRSPEKRQYKAGSDRVTLTCSTDFVPPETTVWLWEYQNQNRDSYWRSVSTPSSQIERDHCFGTINDSILVNLSERITCKRIYRCSLATLTDGREVKARLKMTVLPPFHCTGEETMPALIESEEGGGKSKAGSTLASRNFGTGFGIGFGGMCLCIIIVVTIVHVICHQPARRARKLAKSAPPRPVNYVPQVPYEPAHCIAVNFLYHPQTAVMGLQPATGSTQVTKFILPKIVIDPPSRNADDAASYLSSSSGSSHSSQND